MLIAAGAIAAVSFVCAILTALFASSNTFGLLFLLLWFSFTLILCGAATASARPVAAAVIASLSCAISLAFSAALIWT